MKRKHGAFTLTELLVTVGITVLLAVLLLGVFSRVRENGRRSWCESNLKQIGLGVLQYVQDNDEFYPAILITTHEPFPDAGPNWTAPAPGFPVFWEWQQVIFRYTKNDDVFRCPNCPAGQTHLNMGNYGANSNVMGYPSRKVLASRIVSVASTYMICDAGWSVTSPTIEISPTGAYMPGTGDLGIVYDPSRSPSILQSDFQSGRHFGGINMCFADGHVKWLNNATVLAQARLTEADPSTGAWSITAPPA